MDGSDCNASAGITKLGLSTVATDDVSLVALCFDFHAPSFLMSNLGGGGNIKSSVFIFWSGVFSEHLRRVRKKGMRVLPTFLWVFKDVDGNVLAWEYVNR